MSTTQSELSPGAPDAVSSTGRRARALVQAGGRWFAKLRGPASAKRSPHGIWAPGIKALRNLSMARKTTVLGMLALLPVLLLLSDSAALWHRRAEEAQIALLTHRQIVAIERVSAHVQKVSHVMWLHELGMSGDIVAVMRGEERAQFLALQHAFGERRALPPADTALLARLQERLEATHEEFLLRFDAQPVEFGGNLHAARRQSLQALTVDLTIAHRQVADRWYTMVHNDRSDLLLFKGLAEPQFELLQQLDRLLGTGLQVLHGRAGGPVRRDMQVALVRADMLVERSLEPIEHIRRQRLLDATEVDRLWADIDAFRRAARALVDAPNVGAGPTSDAAAYAQLAQQAALATSSLQAMATEALGERLREGQSQLRREQAVHLASLVALLALCGYALVCSYKVINGGLKHLVAQLDELGRGNLSMRPKGWGRDEIGRALKKLGESTTRMSSLFEAVTQGVAAVSHASREVATGNSGLSGRSGDVKRSIDEVTERATVFSDAMDRCAREVEQAAEHVRAMRADAQRSRKAMNTLRERMRSLQARSREITQSVRLVESVAFQTKLLSLNASVEAARAGQSGRGFAVVAQEVRALAQRSEAAARQIQSIVGGSVAEIEEGNRMTDRASQAVAHTDEEIQAVDRIMNDIVRIARESMDQSQQVLGIARGVEQTVAGNTQLVGQLAEASTALRDQGDALKRSVHHFVLS